MAKKKTAKKKGADFEQSLEELETIVAKLEGGNLGLAESLDCYEHGVHHLKACYHQLSQAERRIEVVTGVDASGQPRTEPFEDADEDASGGTEDGDSLAAKGASRSRRRSTKRRGKPQSEVDDPTSLF